MSYTAGEAKAYRPCSSALPSRAAPPPWPRGGCQFARNHSSTFRDVSVPSSFAVTVRMYGADGGIEECRSTGPLLGIVEPVQQHILEAQTRELGDRVERGCSKGYVGDERERGVARQKSRDCGDIHDAVSEGIEDDDADGFPTHEHI